MTVETRVSPMSLLLQPGGIMIDLDTLQGSWTSEQYLKLTNRTAQLIEFTDGTIEVLPMPTRKHQAISLFLLLRLLAVIRASGGAVFYAPLRLQIRPGKFREPDLLVLLQSDDPRNQDAFWLGADLVIEIVNPDAPERDLVEKVADYAEAGIPEYWIVNPLDETISVLALVDAAYTTHGRFQRGSNAVSRLLGGFSVEVDAVFNVV